MGQLRAAGRNDLQAHNESRPPHVEALAIANLLSLNEIAGVRLHIAHVSSRAALVTIQRYQAEGADVSGENAAESHVGWDDALAQGLLPEWLRDS